MANFKKVSTGNGYQNDLIATTNDRLEMTVSALEDLNHSLTSNMMFLQGDVQDLTDVIKKANQENDKLQKRFLFLTVVGIALAAVQLIQVVDLISKWVTKLIY
jgi:hypothetical protein